MRNYRFLSIFCWTCSIRYPDLGDWRLTLPNAFPAIQANPGFEGQLRCGGCGGRKKSYILPNFQPYEVIRVWDRAVIVSSAISTPVRLLAKLFRFFFSSHVSRALLLRITPHLFECTTTVLFGPSQRHKNFLWFRWKFGDEGNIPRFFPMNPTVRWRLALLLWHMKMTCKFHDVVSILLNCLG